MIVTPGGSSAVQRRSGKPERGIHERAAGEACLLEGSSKFVKSWKDSLKLGVFVSDLSSVGLKHLKAGVVLPSFTWARLGFSPFWVRTLTS